MYGNLQQLAAATPSNQPLTLAGWNNNAQIAGQCTAMWPQQTCRGCFLDDVQCDHQYGECNTKRRGLTATILGADVSVSEQLSEEQS